MARIYGLGWELGSIANKLDTPYYENTGGAAVKAISSAVKNTISGIGGSYSAHLTNAGAAGRADYDLIFKSISEGDSAGGFWVRFYIRVDTAPSTDSSVLLWYALGGGLTNRGQIKLNSAGAFELWSSGDDTPAQIGGDSASIAGDGLFHRVEGYFINNGANMTLELLLDGESVATGTSTKKVGNVGRIFFGMIDATTGYDVYFDDLALNDSSGTAQNSYPGAGVQIALRPAGAGDVNNLAGGTGTTFAEFDEVTPDADTSYSEIVNDNNLVEFAIDDPADQGMGASDTISVVQVGYNFRTETAADASIAGRIKSEASGLVTQGTTVGVNHTAWYSNYGSPPSAQGDRYYTTSHIDPQAGGAWTRTLLQTAQIGVVVPDAAPDVWLTSLWALVDFIPTTVTQGTVDVLDPENSSVTVTVPSGAADAKGLVYRTCTTTPLTIGADGVQSIDLSGLSGGQTINLSGLVPGCTVSVATYYQQGSNTYYGTTSTSSTTAPIANHGGAVCGALL